MEKPENLTPVDVWNDFLDTDEFKDQANAIIPSALESGERRDILVVTGENASGKSLAFMIINQLGRNFAKQDKVNLEVMDIGMGRRTKSGIEKALIFGDENIDSTGNISLKVMQTAVSTSRKRTNFHYLMLDEPDIGVGEGYHNAIGRFLADFAGDMSASASSSPPTAAGLRSGFSMAAHQASGSVVTSARSATGFATGISKSPWRTSSISRMYRSRGSAP
ncbi:hypothetical protein OIU34_22250 [Pararhizobium sp. BT-229]|uniref:hypothetical protein n=1 Tax=Pararhizobium sp. BT-229 TaxID=2986923 RepID=UPI0021F7B316|nr:hypothetical protein [Pararhizobium sp. BT-229]MCV9964616.1 hypothetical protein [Pararhizobium sp. BT-229]